MLKPKTDDKYYYVDTCEGCIYSDLWMDSCMDNNRYSMGYVFKTEKEAQKELDRRLAEVELLDLCDWEGGVFYSINYYVSDNSFDWLVGKGSIFSPYRFKSVESVKKAIETLGKDKLKLIFRIED